MDAEQDSTVYSLLSGVDVRPLDASFTDHKYLISVEDRQFAATGGVARLVEILKEGDASPATLAADLRGHGFADASAERVLGLIRSLRAKGIVRPAASPGEPPASARRESPVRLRRVLIPAGQVPLLAAGLTGLFRRPVVAVLLAAVAAAHLFFYFQVFPSFRWAVASLPASHYLLLMALTTATTLWHELGHAAACRRYGCAPGAIGWGVYLFSPVFYTDVSTVWRLPRRQRAVVDAAGVYFEAVAAAVVGTLYLVWANELLAYAFLLIDLSILTQLTPILRRDGYWVVADLIGHTNLRDASLHVIQGGLGRLLGRRTPMAPPVPVAPRLRAVVLAYTVLSVLLTAALFGWLGTRLVTEALVAIPSLLASLAAGPHGPAFVAASLLRLTLYVVFLLLVGASAWRFARFLGLWLTAGAALPSPSGKEAVS